MKTYHAIVMAPVLVEIVARDIQEAEYFAKHERDRYQSYYRPDGEQAGPYILTIAEVNENGYGTPDKPTATPLLGPDRHDPVYGGHQPDDPGPRAA